MVLGHRPGELRTGVGEQLGPLVGVEVAARRLQFRSELDEVAGLVPGAQDEVVVRPRRGVAIRRLVMGVAAVARLVHQTRVPLAAERRDAVGAPVVVDAELGVLEPLRRRMGAGPPRTSSGCSRSDLPWHGPRRHVTGRMVAAPVRPVSTSTLRRLIPEEDICGTSLVGCGSARGRRGSRRAREKRACGSSVGDGREQPPGRHLCRRIPARMARGNLTGHGCSRLWGRA